MRTRYQGRLEKKRNCITFMRREKLYKKRIDFFSHILYNRVVAEHGVVW